MKVHDHDKPPARPAPAPAAAAAADHAPAPPKPPAKRGAVGAKTAVGGAKGSGNDSIATLPKIPKDDALKKLILDSIKDNLLFRARGPASWHPAVAVGAPFACSAGAGDCWSG